MLYTSSLKGKVTIMPSIGVEVSIVPGAGEMDDALWEKIADSDTVKDLIESRMIEINEHPADKTVETPASKTATKPKAE
jgi:hypothetical protein